MTRILPCAAAFASVAVAVLVGAMTVLPQVRTIHFIRLANRGLTIQASPNDTIYIAPSGMLIVASAIAISLTALACFTYMATRLIVPRSISRVLKSVHGESH